MPPLALLALISAVVAVLSLALLGRVLVRQRQTEERLRIQKSYLDDLFESSDDPAVLIGPEGCVLRANEPFQTLLGYGPSELEEMSLADLLLPDGRDEEAVRIVPRVLRGEPVNAHARALCADGREVELSVMGGPIRIPGEAGRAFLVFRDLTRQILVDAAFHRLEQAVDTMQLGVTVTDLEGRIVYINPADAALHGYVPEELVGKDVRILAPEETHRHMPPEEIANRSTWRRESVNRRRDGTTFPVQLMSDLVRDADGRPIGVVTTCEDITERKMMERALRESEERYARAMRGANDGIWEWNLETGEVFFSSRWKEIVGESGRDLAAGLETWLERVHPEDRAALESELSAHRDGTTPRLENEHRIRHRDGTYLWVLTRGMADRDPEGRTVRITGSITDITDRKGAEQQLAYEALYDPLTGLPNRAFLDDLLKRAMRRLRRQSDYTFAVLFVDLDRFKQINDTLGHVTGDRVLVEVARRLQTCVRPGDVVTRLAGDEFCILLDDIGDGRDASRVARRILEHLDDPIQVDHRTLFTGASIGIAVSDSETEEPDHLMKNADTAMYRAKTGGRGRFEVFDRSMQERAMELMRLENDLRTALDNDQFRLVYHPVVKLEDRRIIGLEALLRWEHPQRGEIPPDQFVPIAEETGVLIPMGWWVLEKACDQMAHWSRQFPSMSDLSVSVNLSSKQLRQPDLLNRVHGALQRSGLPAERLLLEVSEKALMEEPEWHEEVLAGLEELGVRVQIDDFGTGTSSLSYLGRFRVSTLKIDQSFVQQVAGPDSEAAVVQAIITLARQMGIRVVAEGIETNLQGERLRSLNCDDGQGFLFSQPLEVDAVTAVLAGEEQLLGA